MSEAEAAAKMAERMAQWRSAHKRPDVPRRGPSAGGPAVQTSAVQPRAAQSPAADHPARQLQFDLNPALASRVDRALRMAAVVSAPQTERPRVRSVHRARAYGGAFTSLLAEGPNMNALGMLPEPGPQQALQLAYAPGNGAGAAAIAASRALWQTLEGSVGQVPRRARAFEVAMRAR